MMFLVDFLRRPPKPAIETPELVVIPWINITSSQNGSKVTLEFEPACGWINLTPAAARGLAADLLRLAAEIDR